MPLDKKIIRGNKLIVYFENNRQNIFSHLQLAIIS